jgi:bifunctional DNase/RNase
MAEQECRIFGRAARWIAFFGSGRYDAVTVKNDVMRIDVRGVLPTSNGCAVFVGNDEKTFVIYVDHGVGAAITMFLRNTPKERPLTHDLIGSIFKGLGVRVERVIINDLKNSTYYARLILLVENELGKKILEIDGRPSDCMALAVQHKSPIYVTRKVFDVVEDMSEVLKRMNQEEGEGFSTPEETE